MEKIEPLKWCLTFQGIFTDTNFNFTFHKTVTLGGLSLRCRRSKVTCSVIAISYIKKKQPLIFRLRAVLYCLGLL